MIVDRFRVQRSAATQRRRRIWFGATERFVEFGHQLGRLKTSQLSVVHKQPCDRFGCESVFGLFNLPIKLDDYLRVEQTSTLQQGYKLRCCHRLIKLLNRGHLDTTEAIFSSDIEGCDHSRMRRAGRLIGQCVGRGFNRTLMIAKAQAFEDRLVRYFPQD